MSVFRVTFLDTIIIARILQNNHMSNCELRSWHSELGCYIQTVITTELRSSASITSKVVSFIYYSGVKEVTLHAVGVA
jgi:hypothetical protein